MTRPLSAGTSRSAKMVTIFKRNDKLYVQYKAFGKLKQKSTKLNDTSQNRKFIEKEVIPALEKKILQGDFDNEKPQKFSYYAKRYLSKKTKLKTYDKVCQYVNVINETFGNILIDKIKVSDIEDWVEIRGKINSVKTIKNYLSAMSGVFKEGMKCEVIFSNKVHMVELEPHEAKVIEPFSAIEVGKLLKHAKGPLKLFIAIGFFTGLRTGEILALKKSDIDLRNREVNVSCAISKGRLQSPKTKESIRKVPIFDDLVPYLESITDEGYIFAKKDKTHYSSLSGHYKRAWEKLLEDCSIEYRKIYGTRHTFIVNMIRNSGLSILDVAQTAGHSSVRMVITHYGKYIRNENMLKIRTDLKLFTDLSTDSVA